jgi:hypothetical protein
MRRLIALHNRSAGQRVQQPVYLAALVLERVEPRVEGAGPDLEPRRALCAVRYSAWVGVPPIVASVNGAPRRSRKTVPGGLFRNCSRVA